MDDKTFLASYLATESTRVKDALKDMVERGEAPTEAEKEAMIGDLESTLRRLMQVVEQIQHAVDAEEANERALDESIKQ